MSIPAYLIRVYSDKSNGYNKPGEFRPPFLNTKNIVDLNEVTQDLKRIKTCLTKAFEWRNNNTDNCVVFTTDSPLFAIAYALWKRTEGEHNIRIAIIKTSTATDHNRSPVIFRHGADLINQYNLYLYDGRYNKPCEHEFASIGALRPGDGSFDISLNQLLDHGLFRFHPVLEFAGAVKSKSWRALMHELRYLWYTRTPPSSTCVPLAAYLARAASPVTARDLKGDKKFPFPIFAMLLSLQRYKFGDSSLGRWLDENCDYEILSSIEPDKVETVGYADLIQEDTQQFRHMCELLQDVVYSDACLHPGEEPTNPYANDEMLALGTLLQWRDKRRTERDRG